MELKEKVILITGGTGGLGRAVCKRLIGAGAVVVTTYREQSEYDSLAKDLGDQLQGQKADAVSASDMSRLVEKIVNDHGRLDGLVCLVGGYAGGKVGEMGGDVLEKMFSLNLQSAFVSVSAAMPAIRASKSGRIILVGTRNLVRPPQGGMSAYLASKAGVFQLVQSLSEELSGSDATANCILPGTMDTPGNRSAMPKANFDDWADPAAVAEVIAFLCSHASRSVKGAAIPVVGKY